MDDRDDDAEDEDADGSAPPETDDDAALAESATVYCPYCAEPVEVALDPGGGPLQEYVEDCEVCCRPWLVRVEFDRRGEAEVSVVREDE